MCYRIFDVNLNRCTEGLRVLEDIARLLWKDERLFSTFRKHRHNLAIIRGYFKQDLVHFRDEEQDFGRTIKEHRRTSFRDVYQANLKRCSESLRVLEEFSKISHLSIKDDLHEDFKNMRFNIYKLERIIYELGYVR